MMTELLKTTFDGTPIPTSSSLDTSIFANVPHENTEKKNASSLHDTPRTVDSPPDTASNTSDDTESTTNEPINARLQTTADDTPDATNATDLTEVVPSSTESPNHVFLNVARVLIVVVLLLSIVYMIYWVLQNIYGIDIWESVKDVCGWTSLSKQFSTPLSEWNTFANTTTHVADTSTHNAMELSTTPLSNVAHGALPASQNVSASIIEPIKNMFGVDSNAGLAQTQAPHADGVFLPQRSGPLTKEGSDMKKVLSDKTVSTLLDMMAQIK